MVVSMACPKSNEGLGDGDLKPLGGASWGLLPFSDSFRCSMNILAMGVDPSSSFKMTTGGN